MSTNCSRLIFEDLGPRTSYKDVEGEEEKVKTTENLFRLNIINEYNYRMNGVDKHDQLRGNYKFRGGHWRIRKWTSCIYLWALETKLTQSYILYKIHYQEIKREQDSKLKQARSSQRVSVSSATSSPRSNINEMPRLLSHLEFRKAIVHEILGKLDDTTVLSPSDGGRWARPPHTLQTIPSGREKQLCMGNHPHMPKSRKPVARLMCCEEQCDGWVFCSPECANCFHYGTY